MNRVSVLSPLLVLGLVACDTMDRPITSSSFDPLRPPGGDNLTVPTTGVVPFKPGQFVRAAMDNTAFFKARPSGESDADKLLTRGTSMKVISHADSYLKVELDSGEVGFVPAVMVEDPRASTNGPVTQPGEFQVYPPLPSVPPAEKPPEGAIPTVIDPEAPAPPKTAPPPPSGN